MSQGNRSVQILEATIKMPSSFAVTNEFCVCCTLNSYTSAVQRVFHMYNGCFML